MAEENVESAGQPPAKTTSETTATGAGPAAAPETPSAEAAPLSADGEPPAAGTEAPPAEESPVAEDEVPEGEAPEGETPEGEAEEDDLPPVAYELEDLGALRKKLKVTVPRERLDAKRDAAINDLRIKVQIPGFRIGRAPRRLIEKRYGTELKDDTKSAMVLFGYTEAVKKSGLKVLGEPELTPEKLDAIALPDSGPLTFDLEVEVRPEFELPPLDGIAVVRRSVAVTEDDVTRAIDTWRRRMGRMEKIAEPAQPDDVLVGDMTFQIEGQDQREHANVEMPVRPRAIEGIPWENLGKELTGASAGQTVSAETTVPAGHPDEAARGRKATLKLAVKEVRRLKVPELTGEFLSGLGFDKPEDFRAWFRGRLQVESESRQKVHMRQQVYDYLLNNVKLDLPEGVLARMKDRALARRANELMMQGVPKAEIDKHIDELSVHAGEEAVRELKTLFIVQRVADELKVEVTAGEVNSLIAQMAARYDRRPDSLREELQKRDGMEQLYMQILEQKAIDQLLANAKVVDETAPPAAEAAPETPADAAASASQPPAPTPAADDDRDAP